MSGLSLMSSFGGSEFRGGEIEHHGQIEGSRIIDSGDSVQSMRSSNGSPGPSGGIQIKGGISRPPGLGGPAVPSPIGKPGHSYTSSASTAQNLTLTPTSSLDGGDLYARQSSPFHGDGPSLSSDYSRRVDESELPPGFASLSSSFDHEDGEHDGLLGLQALRDRAMSSPGPLGLYGSSPPIRGHAGYDDGRPMRPRAVSRDNGRSQSVASRPPLSGGSGLSPHTTDSKSYFSGSGSRSRDHSPTPTGIISRPGIPQYDSDPSRRRSLGVEGVQPFCSDRNQPSIDQLASKFGQMNSHPHVGIPSVGRQVHHGLQKFQRASSLPGLMRGLGPPDEYYNEELAESVPRRGSDFGYEMSSNIYHNTDYTDSRYNQVNPYGQDQVARSHMLTQRRTSLQSVPGPVPVFYGHNQNMHRRESSDFVPGHNRYPDGVPVIAPNDDFRMYTNPDDRGSFRTDRLVSPSHSPIHVNYGVGSHHSRHLSDAGASTLSSSPASLSSSGMSRNYGQDLYVGNVGRGRHRVTHSDDDLSHPLVGEHIDVNGDDRGFPPMDILEPPGVGPRGRGISVEQPLPYYGGASSAHVMPTTGSAPLISMPKVVYNIKFKRTQRTFVLGPRLNRDLKIGTYVKVEADRGEDLGIVVGKVPSEKYLSSRSNFRGVVNEMGAMPPSGISPSGSTDLKRIIRLATHDEVSLLTMKREEEDELLKICRAKVLQRALPMNVVDAEYQFDRHKLTFFFEAEGRVDFRELVRDLFSIYKTRIWMQQLDKSTSGACPAAPEESQYIVMDDGTPIIAPESEYSDFARGAPDDNSTD